MKLCRKFGALEERIKWVKTLKNPKAGHLWTIFVSAVGCVEKKELGVAQGSHYTHEHVV